MNNSLTVFDNAEFGTIRFLEIDGKLHAVGIDVARALGYLDTTNAIRQHCRWVVKHHIPHPQSIEKCIEILAIPEGDIYRLIAKSKLHKAQEFESWVFDVVLPSIREAKGYVQAGSEEAFIDNHFSSLSDETKKLMVQDLIKNRKVLQSKADYYDNRMTSDGTFPTTSLAIAVSEHLGMKVSAEVLNDTLYKLGTYDRRIKGTQVISEKYKNKGWHYTKEGVIVNKNGRKIAFNQVRWTPAAFDGIPALIKSNLNILEEAMLERKQKRSNRKLNA